MPSLFDPIKLGATLCPNRIVMAPLTRGRATGEHVPTEIMRTYYAQRTEAGLIVTEGTGISREGLGWPHAPGIWSTEQVAGWLPVVEAVHEAGGRIFCQLWHMGRLVHPSFLDGTQPVSSSATTAPYKAHTYDGRQPYVEARALTTEEIAKTVDDYARAAAHAMAAGFDGVQIHGANGYLVDQFLRDATNLRDDDYGGPVENRIRFLGEVTRAVAEMVGAERTAVRLSPNGDSQGVNDSDPQSLFPAAAAMLGDIGIAFLELREPRRDGTFGTAEHDPIAPAIRKAFAGPLVLNSDYDLTRAEAALGEEQADAISFGRPFISNPDLPTRFARKAELTPDDRASWYTPGEQGYIDYPALAA